MASTLTLETLAHEIKKAILTSVDRAVEEEITEAQNRLKARIPTIVAEVGVSVQNYFDAMGGDTVLQIRLGRIVR